MFWKNERHAYGWVEKEAVQVYECSFTTSETKPDGRSHKANMKCLVVCNDVEEAIAACRQKWPEDFVLTQVVKRNSSMDLIVLNSVLGKAETDA